MADYFKERDKENTRRLLEIRDDLPDFCEEFFIGIEPVTSVLTRLGYAYDLRIFFDYLVKRVGLFRLKKDTKNIINFKNIDEKLWTKYLTHNLNNLKYL